MCAVEQALPTFGALLILAVLKVGLADIPTTARASLGRVAGCIEPGFLAPFHSREQLPFLLFWHRSLTDYEICEAGLGADPRGLTKPDEARRISL